MSVTEPTAVAFELDRFEFDEGRLAVAGRWVGVRGRRFVRPSLTRVGGDRSARVLAELEHKPWPVDEGEVWEAAFPWTGSVPARTEFELAVAPDICVRLPSPGPGGKGDRVLKAFRPGEPQNGGAPRRPRETPSQHDQPAPDIEQLPKPIDTTRAERDEAVLRGQQAAARQAELSRQWDRAVADRDRALSERDEARHERDEARHERDERRSRHDAELRDARHEREAALVSRDQFSAALAGATEARDRAILQRDRAVAERDAIAGELRAALAELERRRSVAAVPAQARPVAPAQAPAPGRPIAPIAPIAPIVQPAEFRPRRASRVKAAWTTRILALAAFAAVVFVLLITLASR
jgi:hypothetical protein